jgi:hypothetical protein
MVKYTRMLMICSVAVLLLTAAASADVNLVLTTPSNIEAGLPQSGANSFEILEGTTLDLTYTLTNNFIGNVTLQGPGFTYKYVSGDKTDIITGATLLNTSNCPTAGQDLGPKSSCTYTVQLKTGPLDEGPRFDGKNDFLFTANYTGGQIQATDQTIYVSDVPEPSVVLLLPLGVAAAFGMRRLRFRTGRA